MAVRVRVLIETLRHDGRRRAVGEELTLAPAAAAALIALRAVAAVGGRAPAGKAADRPQTDTDLGAGPSGTGPEASQPGPAGGVQDPEPAADAAPADPEAPAEAPSGEAPIDASAADSTTAPTADADPRPSINTASAAALAKVHGLGAELARAIVAHRKAKGPFGRIDDLVAVPGIGVKKAQALAALVTL